jgi:hypothetical protein
MKENENIDPMLEAKATCLGGCLTMVVMGVLLAIVLFLTICNGAFERKDPRAVTYREKVSDTDTSEIWRNVTYELVSVSYDTVPKVRRERSTIEPEILAPKVQTIPKDRVDLNDYLGDPDDGTDWNYTEIDEEAEKYLDDLGIYWDSDKEYWRKRK